MRENIKNFKLQIRNLYDKGLLHIFISNAVTKVLGFVCLTILVRLIGKSEYGVYTYANNMYGFFILANGLGMTSSILQLCSEKNETDKSISIYRYCNTMGLLFNIFLSLLIIIFSYSFEFPIKGSNSVLLLMSLLPITEFIPNAQRVYMRTQFLTKEYSFALVLTTLIRVVFSCTLAIFLEIKGVIIGSYIANIMSAIFIYYYYKIPVSIKLSFGKIKDLNKKLIFKIGIISMANSGLSKLMYLFDILVIGFIISDESIIASYKVASYIPNALIFIPVSVIIFVYPYFAKNQGNKKWLLTKYKILTGSIGILNLVIGITLIILAPFIIKTFFGVQYLDGLLYFRILCVNYIIAGTFISITGNLLVTQRKLGFNFFITVFSSVINIVLNIIFITRWQAAGAAIATLITTVITSIFSTVYLLSVIQKSKKIS